ncbi:MAG: tRNA preQ1(34) S-adenosylmethionine ribosyltransferase-isomerase QueA [Terriglobia bacterium]
MRLQEFAYPLPEELIAQRPLAARDTSRMLVVERAAARFTDRSFRDLPALLRGDELVVVNNTRVFPARLFARRRGLTAQPIGRRNPARREYLQARIEVLLTRELEPGLWEALVRPGRRVRTGERLAFGLPASGPPEAIDALEAEVVGRGEFGLRQLRFPPNANLWETLERLGHVPLPPYIKRADEPADRERYQTVFARPEKTGAVAAPTAGLHFTPAILDALRRRGIEVVEITLTVGLATFQPIHTEALEEHRMGPEPYEISPTAAQAIARARASGRPILAVGTTVVRALESVATRAGRLMAGSGAADLFIYPGYQFKVVDQLLTNFHLPRSSLLVLVSAFAGRELILRAYAHAVREKYRFYSYGDCMLIR